MSSPEPVNSTLQTRPEIVFFDCETTIPTRTGQGFAILEFGAMLVCPNKLEELSHYETLIRPDDLSLISSLSVRCNGITREAVVSAPRFDEVADKVFDILHGRIWAGHNIIRFDCKRIKEAFDRIGKPAPQAIGYIDSLVVLTEKFGRRAGDMKMASLATYFGLKKQTHRSLDDVRLNLEVLKCCAAVLFLESTLPDIFTENSWVSPNATTRSRNGKLSAEILSRTEAGTSSSSKFEVDKTSSPSNQRTGDNYPILSLTRTAAQISNLMESSAAQTDSFNMKDLSEKVEGLQSDVNMEEKPVVQSFDVSSSVTVNGSDSLNTGFLDPDEVSISSITASHVPFYHGTQKIRLCHEDIPLQLSCGNLKVRFGISTKFVDHAGRPRLSFVVDASPSLCRVLDACDGAAQKLSLESGSSSDWRPVVTRKNGFLNYPTVRLHIPTVGNGDSAKYNTEIYQKEPSGTIQKLVFSRFDVAELDSLFKPGTIVDAYFSLDPYDYQQNAGVRLVAKKLILQSD